MRAVSYSRVSSEEQLQGYSIDAQLRATRQFAQEKGWVLTNEYVDDGKSARTDDINKRPKFKDMLRAASNREFDVLIVHKLDRFSRNLVVTLRSFEELAKNNITFISISEQIDYTTPMGRVFLATLGAFAQYYSDNLSQETKKGWDERRRQGLYCGTLPFGAIKGEDGIPAPDMKERELKIDGNSITLRNYEGLKMAFELAEQGKSDREVAVILNSCGYKTTGTHGPRAFSKDTVKGMLKNQFYIGQLKDGNDSLIKALHKPLIDIDSFAAVEKIRNERVHSPKTIRSDAHIYSLSGVARCGGCGSTLRSFKGRGRVRLTCNGRIKGMGCAQSSTFLDVYEAQLLVYLKSFSIPEDYQKKILEAHKQLESVYDTENQQSALQGRLSRLKELYEWGHINKNEYLKDSNAIQKQLEQIQPRHNNSEALTRLAQFLKDVTAAWEHASQEQRNRLASCLFEAIWIKEKKVVAVTPRHDFKPFFDLCYEGKPEGVLHWRPRGDSNP